MDLQSKTLSIGHFVRVYALVVSEGGVERTAADAFLAAETRKVNAKWVTKKKNSCFVKAQRRHARWQLIQQATSVDSTEVKRFMECEELDINLQHDSRAKVPKCCGTKIDSRSCISSDSNSGLLSDSSSCSSGSNDSRNFSDSNNSSSGDGSSGSSSSSSAGTRRSGRRSAAATTVASAEAPSAKAATSSPDIPEGWPSHMYWHRSGDDWVAAMHVDWYS